MLMYQNNGLGSPFLHWDQVV